MALQDDHPEAGSLLQEEADVLWTRWQTQKADWLEDPQLRAQVVLVDACLRALPEILTGKKPATDILFPNSSMERVEGIYRNNAIADGFNRRLGQVVEAYCQQRIAADLGASLSILEVGAGTGGTTAGSAETIGTLSDSSAGVRLYRFVEGFFDVRGRTL